MPGIGWGDPSRFVGGCDCCFVFNEVSKLSVQSERNLDIASERVAYRVELI